MSEFAAFFAENAVGECIEEVFISERFKDKEGKSVPWKIKAITEAENQEIRKASTRKVKAKGGMQMPETDPNAYSTRLVAECVVFPNLKDSALQASYGVQGADNLIAKMLYPGEFAELVTKVQELNGFDQDINETSDKAKN